MQISTTFIQKKKHAFSYFFIRIKNLPFKLLVFINFLSYKLKQSILISFINYVCFKLLKATKGIIRVYMLIKKVIKYFITKKQIWNNNTGNTISVKQISVFYHEVRHLSFYKKFCIILTLTPHFSLVQ